MTELLYKELSYVIVGAAMEVHKILGPGFLEAVYHTALAHEFNLRNIPFNQHVKLPVTYKDIFIGEYEADFVIDGKIILELKAASDIHPQHEAQVHHYLVATGLHLAIILN